MRVFKKKSLRFNAKNAEVITSVTDSVKSICEMDFENYMGQTVTVYVNAGGMVGNGFTGVLLWYCSTYIKLLVRPSIAPICSLGNACDGRTANPLFCTFCPYNETLGTMVEIPVHGIVAFVHNVVSSKN